MFVRLFYKNNKIYLVVTMDERDFIEALGLHNSMMEDINKSSDQILEVSNKIHKVLIDELAKYNLDNPVTYYVVLNNLIANNMLIITTQFNKDQVINDSDLIKVFKHWIFATIRYLLNLLSVAVERYRGKTLKQISKELGINIKEITDRRGEYFI